MSEVDEIDQVVRFIIKNTRAKTLADLREQVQAQRATAEEMRDLHYLNSDDDEERAAFRYWQAVMDTLADVLALMDGAEK